MMIKIRFVVAMCSLVGSLLATACAQKPPELTDRAVNRALDGWISEHMAPFWKHLGQEPPKPLGMDWWIVQPQDQPASPVERSLSFKTPQLIMLREPSGQFVSFSGNGTARFRLENNAWYLVHVEFTNGVTVKDIHWKVGDE